MDLKPPLPAIAAGVVLIVLLEFLVGGYSEYGFGFYAWFGFGSCAVLIVAALALGKVLKRDDDYYLHDAGHDAGQDTGRDGGQDGGHDGEHGGRDAGHDSEHDERRGGAAERR